MKKCSKCGLVQDDRRQCIDCGAALGETISKADENRYLDELSDTVSEMSERCVEFYVSKRQKWFGLGAAAAAILSVIVFVLGVRFTPNSEGVALYSVFGIILGTSAALHLLFPRAMWKLETLRYRFHISGDYSPSENYLSLMKVFSYVCFGIGVPASVWSLVQFIINIK